MKNIIAFALVIVAGFVGYKLYKIGFKIGDFKVGGGSNSSSSNDSTELNVGQIGGGVNVSDPLNIGGNNYTTGGQSFAGDKTSGMFN